MHTEEDLRAVFGALELEAPEPGGILAGFDRFRQRRTIRRRTVRMAAVAAATMALAAGSLTLPDLFKQAQPSDPAGHAWEFPFAMDEIPGFRANIYQLAPKHQLVKVSPVTDEWQEYIIEVFAAGEYDPAGVRAGQPITVRGKPGFYRADLPCHCSDPITGEPVDGRAPVPVAIAAWEYAPNAWATVFSPPISDPSGVPITNPEESVLRVAQAVRFDRTTPLRLPFRVGELPDHLRPARGTMIVSGKGAPSARVILEPTVPDRPDLAITAQRADQRLAPTPREITIGQMWITVSSGGAGRPGFLTGELDRVTRSITAAGDIDDPSTWTDAADTIATR
jgi:hypothetical protein